MKIILITAIPKLGKIGDLIEVKNGYAKNFLIPSKKAICFTEDNHKMFKAKKEEFEQNNKANLDVAGKVQSEISGKDIVIIENASDDGRLYGSVNSQVIATKINSMINKKLPKVQILRTEIFLKKPIKEIGVYEVRLNLHSEVSFDVRLIVTRSESEIESLLKPTKKESAKSEKFNTQESYSEEVVEASNDEDAEVKKSKPRVKRAKKSSDENSSEV